VLGVQENKPPRFNTATTSADAEDIRHELQEATKLEMANLIFGSTIELLGVNDWIFWEVWSPLKRKKELRTA
jgi:hypothetical protein